MDLARRRQQNRNIGKQLLPYFLVIPALIFYVLFWLRPVLQQFIDSFTNEAGQFTLNNYRLVFSDPDFGIALANTAIIVVISVVLEFFLALFLALLINRNFRGSGHLDALRSTVRQNQIQRTDREREPVTLYRWLWTVTGRR